MTEQLYDVVVIGGGFCGLACAIKASESGKKVLLVEKRPALGWEATWAFNLDFGGANSPTARRISDDLSKAGGLKEGRADAPITEIVLDRLADEKGISLLFYSYPVRLVYEDDTAFGVVIGSKSGERIVKAKVIVDATEEAVLWRQTDVKSRMAAPRARQVIFFNHLEGELELPLDLGDGVRILPSVWNGEVCAEFEVDECDPLVARRKLPDVIKHIREAVPQLKDALVTHLGNEPFPVAPMVAFADKRTAHPEIKNLFGAGIWASDAENTVPGRIALGEAVGQAASKCEGAKEFPADMMTGSYIRQPEVMSDVLVVGGGTGGAIAAIAAARRGAKTTLIEASPFLGGIGTAGAVHSYCAGTSGGLQDEIDKRVKELTPLFAGKWAVSGFHPDAKKIVLQQAAEAANVDIILNTVVTGVLREDGRSQLKQEENKDEKAVAVSEIKERKNRLLGVTAVASEGISVYRAKVFIDSTGDGDVAVMSGAPFTIGRERDNVTHAFSQCSGVLGKDGRLAFLNFDAGYVDPTDVDDLTRGRRLGIQQYWTDRFTEETRLLYIAPLIGLRQSRQIIGEYELTLADEIAGRVFEDGISFTTTFYDNHGFDYENESDEAALWIWGLGNFSRRIGCEVPYRCLIPKNVEGLILACRAISLSFDAHAGLRMQKDLQRIGEVAGIAAAMAAKGNISPRKVNIEELRAILKENGILDEKFRPKTAIPERKVMELPAATELDKEKTEALVWISTYAGPEAALVLKGQLKSDDPKVRFTAAAALARHKIDEGVQELLKFVEERTEEVTKDTTPKKAVPIWQASVTFLGMAEEKKAVPLLLDILENEKENVGALVAAIRSLERIGDKSVIPNLRELLKRDDLPTKRKLQMSTGILKHMSQSEEEAKWQIELGVAEALWKLGASGEEIREIIEPYLNDPRAHVRRYAGKLMRPLRGGQG